MDFYIDIGFAVLLRLLKDRRQIQKWRPAFLKLAQAIILAFGQDEEFVNAVKSEGVPWTTK